MNSTRSCAHVRTGCASAHPRARVHQRTLRASTSFVRPPDVCNPRWQAAFSARPTRRPSVAVGASAARVSVRASALHPSVGGLTALLVGGGAAAVPAGRFGLRRLAVEAGAGAALVVPGRPRLLLGFWWRRLRSLLGCGWLRLRHRCRLRRRRRPAVTAPRPGGASPPRLAPTADGPRELLVFARPRGGRWVGHSSDVAAAPRVAASPPPPSDRLAPLDGGACFGVGAAHDGVATRASRTPPISCSACRASRALE